MIRLMNTKIGRQQYDLLKAQKKKGWTVDLWNKEEKEDGERREEKVIEKRDRKKRGEERGRKQGPNLALNLPFPSQ